MIIKTKEKASTKHKASYENEIGIYSIYGELPKNASLEVVQSINEYLKEWNEKEGFDKKLIDEAPYLDYGYNFATIEEEIKFKDFVRDYSKYSFMNLSGKPAVVSEFKQNEIFKYEFSSVSDFKTFHKESKFSVLNGKRVETIYFADLWLETPAMRKRYEQTVFDPSNSQDEKIFNFWRGFIEPIKGEVEPFLEHIDKLIKGTAEEKKYIIDLLAYSVRFPDRLTGVALAVRGDQGAGKSTISETMKAICPNHSKIFDNMETLFDFNAETIHTKYFLMEESVWGGEISKQGKLKNLITCPNRAIKIKNLTGFDISNYGFFIFTSNESWMLPVEKGDRRFSIFDTTKDLIDNFDYFNKYYEWLNKDGKHALCHYFMHERNLDNFNPRTVVANTAKTDVKALGLPAIEKYILGLLSDDYTIDALVPLEEQQKNTWDNTFYKVDRSDFYLGFCEQTKREKIEQTLVSRKLSEIFEFQTNWKCNWKNGKRYYYILPDKVTCMEMFSKYIKETPEHLFPSYKELKQKWQN